MKKLIYILLLLFASSCKTKLSDNNLDILNINNPITLSFTDMVRDIKIVPLETLDDVLISDCELIIDKDYIICIDKNRILQFNANNGKFIRVLANKGNGPKEFNTIGSYSIYDGKLFYSEKFKSSKLNIIDLQNGDFLEPVNFESKNKINSLRFCGITSNGDLLIENDTVLLDVYNFDNQTYYEI